MGPADLIADFNEVLGNDRLWNCGEEKAVEKKARVEDDQYGKELDLENYAEGYIP